MQLSNLNPDLIAIIVLAVCALYGAIWGAAGVRILILGAAAAGLAVQQLVPLVHLPYPPWLLALGLFAAVVLLFMLTTERPHRHGRALAAFVGGALAGAVVIACAVAALPAEAQKWLMGSSWLMMEAMTFRWQILAAGLLLGVIMPLLYRRPKRSHH